jgi:hypothetical protein
MMKNRKFTRKSSSFYKKLLPAIREREEENENEKNMKKNKP